MIFQPARSDSMPKSPRLIENLVATDSRLTKLLDGATQLAGARFVNCRLIDCDLAGLNLSEAVFEHCDLGGSDFRGTDASNSRWSNTRGLKASLSGAELSEA